MRMQYVCMYVYIYIYGKKFILVHTCTCKFAYSDQFAFIHFCKMHAYYEFVFTHTIFTCVFLIDCLCVHFLVYIWWHIKADLLDTGNPKQPWWKSSCTPSWLAFFHGYIWDTSLSLSIYMYIYTYINITDI